MILLLTVMVINRKQQIVASYANKGRTLAAWLNSNSWSDTTHPWFSTTSPIASLIGFYVATVRGAKKAGLAPEGAIRKAVIDCIVAGKPLPLEEDRALLHPDRATGVCLPMKLRAELRPKGLRVEFSLVGEDEDSQWLYVWGELLNSANESRLRRCPNCATFWYCVGRTDRRFCTEACKVSFWQRTEKGKEAKKQYMRRHRAMLRKLEKRSAFTANRRKVARNILASLGK